MGLGRKEFGVQVGQRGTISQWGTIMALVPFITGLHAASADARLLNPSASLTLTYSYAATDAENSETEIDTFGQRYRLGDWN